MENKSKNLIHFGILLSGILSILVPFMTDSTYAVNFDSFYSQINEKHQKSLWKLGESLNEGDSFTYRICDGTVPETFISSHCYTIDLTFVSLLESWNGSSWIVQGILNTDTEERFLILQIDPVTFKVTTDKLNIDLANSLEKTIFSLSEHEKKSLKVGTVWDSLDSYFTNYTSLEIKKNESTRLSFGVVEISVLGYDVIKESHYFINDEFPFPVFAMLYSPNIIFPEPLELYNYELMQYSFFDVETRQIIHSVCLESLKINTDENFDDFFAGSTNSSNNFEVIP